MDYGDVALMYFVSSICSDDPSLHFGIEVTGIAEVDKCRRRSLGRKTKKLPKKIQGVVDIVTSQAGSRARLGAVKLDCRVV